MTEFLHMGGYAFFVWTSFGITFFVLLADVIYSLTLQKQLKAKLSQRLKRKRGEV